MVSRAAVTSSESARPPSRREMLYYLGGASLGLLGAGVCGIFAWNSVTHSNRTREDGFLQIALNDLPAHNAPPVLFTIEDDLVSRFYLVQTGNGLLTLSYVCPFHACRLRWQTERYACPCCGSQFTYDGTLIYGAARRDMDRYALEVETPNSLLRTSAAGEPVPIDDATAIYLDEWTLIRGRARR
jgi:hypothetical protein